MKSKYAVGFYKGAIMDCIVPGTRWMRAADAIEWAERAVKSGIHEYRGCHYILFVDTSARNVTGLGKSLKDLVDHNTAVTVKSIMDGLKSYLSRQWVRYYELEKFKAKGEDYIAAEAAHQKRRMVEEIMQKYGMNAELERLWTGRD